MKRIFGGMITAFGLYSVIPVPQRAWNDGNTRYALCFFPLIGCVIAAAELLWHRAAVGWGVAPGLYGAVAALLPSLLSGGIHLDGLVDTADALGARAPAQRRLEILKDPHVGAFGVIYLAGYLLLSCGLWQQVMGSGNMVWLAAAGPVVSRCGNALSLAAVPCARQSGLARLFADSAAKAAVIAANLAVPVVLLAAGLWLLPVWAGVSAAAAAAYWLLHRRMCIEKFGGNTGDLAGWLLQHMEILLLAVAAMGGVVV